MKFKKDSILINASLEDTMLQEGGTTLIFAQRALANTNIDCSDIKYFEIGPKHGIPNLKQFRKSFLIILNQKKSMD